MKNYLIGIDILKIISCIMIFLFHMRGSLGVSYGILNPYIEQGAIFCSVFFIISGFSLFLSNVENDFGRLESVKVFYKKRIITIMPAFIIVWVMYYSGIGGVQTIPFSDMIKIAPLEFIGMRCELLYLPGMNFFWFVSCILIGYICFPFINMMVKQFNIKYDIASLFILYAILLYAKYIEDLFGTSSMTYFIPFYRILEMGVGIISCHLMIKVNKFIKIGKLVKGFVISLALISFVCGYTYCLKYGQRWMLYDIFIIPCMICMLICIDCVESRKRSINRIAKYVTGITYEVYLFQTFVFKFFGELGIGYGFFEHLQNIHKILFAVGLTLILSIMFKFLYFFTKKLLTGRMLSYGK